MFGLERSERTEEAEGTSGSWLPGEKPRSEPARVIAASIINSAFRRGKAARSQLDVGCWVLDVGCSALLPPPMILRRLIPVAIATLCPFPFSPAAQAAGEWPRFRGSNGSGLADGEVPV